MLLGVLDPTRKQKKIAYFRDLFFVCFYLRLIILTLVHHHYQIYINVKAETATVSFRAGSVLQQANGHSLHANPRTFVLTGIK